MHAVPKIPARQIPKKKKEKRQTVPFRSVRPIPGASPATNPFSLKNFRRRLLMMRKFHDAILLLLACCCCARWQLNFVVPKPPPSRPKPHLEERSREREKDGVVVTRQNAMGQSLPCTTPRKCKGKHEKAGVVNRASIPKSRSK